MVQDIYGEPFFNKVLLKLIIFFNLVIGSSRFTNMWYGLFQRFVKQNPLEKYDLPHEIPKSPSSHLGGITVKSKSITRSKWG
jgi:hypothetical protein